MELNEADPVFPSKGEKHMSDENKDQVAQEAVENRDETNSGGADRKAAGPHAREELTDKEKTPGAGSLPSDQGPEADVGSD